MKTADFRRNAAAGCASLILLAGPVKAQAVSVSAGYSGWTCCLADGGGATAALRVDLPIGPVLLLEPGLTWLRLRNEGEAPDQTHYVLELSAQASLPIPGRVRPFLGLGAGFPSNTAGDFFIAVHAVAGLRLGLGPAWHLRAEFRAREARPIQGDLTLGIGRRL